MTLAWWQDGVIYQIYPRSFADSDGDGTGDLPGIVGRLDYLVKLGVQAVWVSPVYPSPMADFGYDVSDYCGVDPLFGTLADMDALIAGAHGCGLKVVLDLVPNHTSDKHPWFVESRRNRGNDRHDWYLWRDPAPGGGPPNNWRSHFGGPAWTFVPERGQFYCHSFLPAQPDLNWRHPGVRTAMFDAMRFWLRRGVDGFRVDVIWLMVKDDQFRDNPAGAGDLFNADRPEVHEVVAAMRTVVDEFPDRVLIGEIYLPADRLVTYYGTAARPECHLPFNFQLLLLETWNAPSLAWLIARYEQLLPPEAWPNWVLGNHDRSRVASRLGQAQARVAAVLLHVLRGTPTIYMGDELGMVDTPIPASEVRDPSELRQPGEGTGRDKVRTPFPWRSGPGAGFTTGVPWLRVGADTPLSEQEGDPRSMYTLYRDLLALRRRTAALRVGGLTGLAADGAVLRFNRGKNVLVLANTSDVEAQVVQGGGMVLVSTHDERGNAVLAGHLTLRPNEAVVLETVPCDHG